MKQLKKVKCVSSGGYGEMNEGEIGTLVEIIPEDAETCPHFTWPEYWKVQQDNGRCVIGHRYRFKILED